MKYVKIEGGVKLSSFISPMSATLSDKPAFDDPRWLFEIKWDGYRAIAELKAKDTRFYSRKGLSYNKAYPTIYNELVKLKIDATWMAKWWYSETACHRFRRFRTTRALKTYRFNLLSSTAFS